MSLDILGTVSFSDNLIIYENPDLIKFYICLVWELIFINKPLFNYGHDEIF